MSIDLLILNIAIMAGILDELTLFFNVHQNITRVIFGILLLWITNILFIVFWDLFRFIWKFGSIKYAKHSVYEKEFQILWKEASILSTRTAETKKNIKSAESWGVGFEATDLKLIERAEKLNDDIHLGLTILGELRKTLSYDPTVGLGLNVRRKIKYQMARRRALNSKLDATHGRIASEYVKTH